MKNKNNTILSNYMEDDYLKLLTTKDKDENDYLLAYEYIDATKSIRKMLDLIIFSKNKYCNSEKFIALLNKQDNKAKQLYNDLLENLYVFMLENNITLQDDNAFILEDVKKCSKYISNIVYKDTKTEYMTFYIDDLKDDEDNDYMHFKSFKKYLSYEIDTTEEKDACYSNILSFDDLKQEDLQLLQMKYLENLTLKEIAMQLNTTDKYIKTKIARLKAKIRKQEDFIDYLNTKENKQKERKALEYYNYSHNNKVMNVKDLSIAEIAKLLKDYKGVDLSKTYQFDNILKLSYK